MNKFLVIIPTFNEAENIAVLIYEIRKLGTEVLVIDDNSPDKTYEIVQKIVDVDKGVHLLKRNSKMGLGSAYREGFKYFLEKDYTHCIEMDADFSHRIADLKKLMDETKNYDLIIGSRYIENGGSIGWDFRRKKLSLYANKIARFILKTNIQDTTSGFRVFSRNALTVIDFENINTNGYGFQIEMAYLSFINNLSIIEIPIIFEERRMGQSKMNSKIIFEALVLLVKIYFNKSSYK